MISYAQNQEDVRLRRLFDASHVGFYIDVGAKDPTIDSVSRYFYDRGWSGINVEPVPELHLRHREARPRDVNLNIGLSDRPGSATLYASKGLSTFSEEQARVHAAQGVHFTKREIPLRTLASVCEEQGVDRIDFLSIDVEGFERRVLEGADFERFRPLAIVIEATRPNTREPSHGDWEDLLLAGRYRYAAFDGLNRYYVREEDAALAPRLEVGPNVFDNYAPHRWLREIERAHSRKAKYKRARFPFGNALARVGSALRGERD
jgi:FkbM family methyltransferase